MNNHDRPPKSAFAIVNGVKLHYLDWGGDGNSVLLLAGFGNSANIFKSFAARLTDDFRLVALTRRCHGQSEITNEGYDLDTRVEDIRRFLDHLGIRTVIMIGHSMAGDELSRFTNLYPERVSKLVYLDAALERNLELATKDPLRDLHLDQEPEECWNSVEEYFQYYQRAHPIVTGRWDVWQDELLDEVEIEPGGSVRYRLTPEVAQGFVEEMKQFKPDYLDIRCPALSFYAMANTHPRLPKNASKELTESANSYYQDVVNVWKKDCAKRFREEVEHSETVEVHGADHYLFLDKEEEVVQKTRIFLLNE